MEQVDEAEATALAIAEVAMVMQTNQEKQFKQMMEMFKEIMKANVPWVPLQAPAPTQPKQRKVCPHCNRPQSKPEKCWELEANAADRPANWKPMQPIAQPIGSQLPNASPGRNPEGVGRTSPLSSGNQGR